MPFRCLKAKINKPWKDGEALFVYIQNKLQIQTCKIAELIEAGSMETCLIH